MTNGILIEYSYSGDDAVWEKAIVTFMEAINADERLKGRFLYEVFSGPEGIKRYHIGRWDVDETVDYLKEQSFFNVFSEIIQKLAGDSLKSIPLLQRFDSQY